MQPTSICCILLLIAAKRERGDEGIEGDDTQARVVSVFY